MIIAVTVCVTNICIIGVMVMWFRKKILRLIQKQREQAKGTDFCFLYYLCLSLAVVNMAK